MSGFRMSLGSAAPQASDDAATFQQLLADMSGTKESIKQAKEWLLQRPDRAEVFAKALQKHVAQQPGFQKLLFAVYLLNDIFFAARTKEDPFRRSFAPVLSDIIRGRPKPLQMINRETSLSK